MFLQMSYSVKCTLVQMIKKIHLHFFPYITEGKEGKWNLVLRYPVPHFLANFKDILCKVVKLNLLQLPTREKKSKQL